ncbi:peptidase M12 [Pseudomonas sp. W2Aug9]|uniref:peptidase M12 n=1 Tax=Pseudomonas sp. W2Aug9 TaxID=1215242 RepID=UPI0020061F71|nr:peptidase M12 [Pseudomonas sp. W2Aug9]MCK3825627.1 peptidase M12 [Pseudomonas sp. W2Aug9]
MINGVSSTPFYPSPNTSVSDNAASETQTQALTRNRRSIGVPSTYWPQNSTIKIAIYDLDMDSEYVKTLKKAASAWLPHINLKFEFVSGSVGDVRIMRNSDGNEGAESEIGTEARNVPLDKPTMKLPPDHTDDFFKTAVKHEFGHMLGAHHDHQHPDSGIPWNPDAAYDYYKRLANFTKKEVDEDVLPLPRDNKKYDFGPYDRDSIMHYPISPYVTDGQWSQGNNDSLTPRDIDWARKTYPRKDTDSDTLHDHLPFSSRMEKNIAHGGDQQSIRKFSPKGHIVP